MVAGNCKGRFGFYTFVFCAFAGIPIEFSPNISMFQSLKQINYKCIYELIVGDFNDV